MSYPEDRFYSKDHEWVLLEGDEGVIGITDFAQQELGDVVFVELPAVGARFAAGQAVGTIESVKAVAELFSPISGEVIDVNQDIDGDPELVNRDSHGRGWLIRMRLEDPTEVASLMRAAQYLEHLKQDQS